MTEKATTGRDVNLPFPEQEEHFGGGTYEIHDFGPGAEMCKLTDSEDEFNPADDEDSEEWKAKKNGQKTRKL